MPPGSLASWLVYGLPLLASGALLIFLGRLSSSNESWQPYLPLTFAGVGFLGFGAVFLLMVWQRRGSLWRWEALGFLALAGLLGLHVAALLGRVDRDSAHLLTLAGEISRGAVPYRDFWHNKPPGLHYWYALLIALTGNGLVAAKVSLLGANLLSTLFVYLAGKELRNEASGLLAALLFLSTMLIYEGTLPLTGPYMVLFLSLGLWLLPRFLKEGLSPGRSFALGAIFALASLFRLPAAAAVPVVVVGLIWASAAKRPWVTAPSAGPKGWRWAKSPASLFLLGFVSPWAVALLLLGIAGALPEFLSGAIFSNLGPIRRYTSLLDYWERNWRLVESFPLPWGLAALGLVLLGLAFAKVRRLPQPSQATRRPVLEVLLAGLLIAMFLGDTVPSYVHPHYWLGHLPFLALASGVAVAAAWPWLVSRWWRLLPALALMGYLFLPYLGGVQFFFREMSHEQKVAHQQRAFAQEIMSRTRPDEKIMVLAAYPLYYLLSERRPAYRYASFTKEATLEEAQAGAIQLLESGQVGHVVIVQDDQSRWAESVAQYVQQQFKLVLENPELRVSLYRRP